MSTTRYGISVSVGRVYRLMRSMELPKMSTDRPKHRPSHPSRTEDNVCRNHLKILAVVDISAGIYENVQLGESRQEIISDALIDVGGVALSIASDA